MKIENKILNFIEKHEWRFAKSMPFIPHWYIVRKNCDDQEFVDFVKYIEKYGIDKPFGKKMVFRYLDIDKYSYWSMKNPIEITENMPLIINRALIKLEVK